MKFAYMPDTHFGTYDQAAPSAADTGEAFDQLIREAVLAEEVGFDAIFLPERHARGETFVPSPLIAATAIAARTSKIKIATTVGLPTLYNPMHLAEQIAMIDVLSQGRFIYGAGVGHHRSYHQTFGVPWERRGKRFEEAMHVLVLALTEERFSFDGEFYKFEDVGLIPKSFQRPRPPIWIGSHTPGKPVDRALDYEGWVLWFLPEWTAAGEWIRSMRERAAESGRSKWEVVVNQDGWLGDDTEATRNRHALRFLRESQYYGAHDYPAEFDKNLDITQMSAIDEALRGLEARQVHFGTAESWVERIGALMAALEPDWLDIRLRGPIAEYGPTHPTFDETLECIRRFGQEVLPAFQERCESHTGR